MIIKTFEKQHIEEAEALALSNFLEARRSVPILPDAVHFPDFNWLVEQGLGVTAMENGRMVGYLCGVGPFENVFGAGIKGVFCPLHAHGAIAEDRSNIYRRMYQAAADKWVERGALSHAITLFSHDAQAVQAFFGYGFGLRCIDGVRGMDPIPCSGAEGFSFRLLPKGEVGAIRQLRADLSAHLAESPCFMPSEPAAVEAWIDNAQQRDSLVFVAEKDGTVATFIEVDENGENYITYAPPMKSICGAFCLPQYRGTGLFAALLNEVVSQLRQRGAFLLGVDYESFNPTAAAAWSKYFRAYTYSVVRRIDGVAG